MLRSLIITLGVAAMLASPAPAQSKAIKFATMVPKGSPWHEILLDMAAEWRTGAPRAGDARYAVGVPLRPLGSGLVLQRLRSTHLPGGPL